jgi:hypothetical protein
MSSKPIDRVFLAAAEAAGQEGLSTSELTGFTVSALDKAIQRLIAAEKIYRGKIGHRTMRYFTRRDWAEAYAASRQTVAKVMGKARVRASWPADAPIHYPPNYKHTVIETPTPGANTPIRTGGYEPW